METKGSLLKLLFLGPRECCGFRAGPGNKRVSLRFCGETLLFRHKLAATDL